ncbi:MAG: patatin-like phospholipase family protein, partial [Gammaproteobacteria bacterium]|nr:patatin-like phospholipase family protein [Gammaproteobacteria bacterium]
MRVALALSGGGVRAAVFHCGVLERLALDGLLESTTFVSTVSGGSLVVGLILCQNGHRWPDSEEFLDAVLPSVRVRLTTATLQWSYAWRSVVLPWRLTRGRAHILAGQLEAQWGIWGSMQDTPETPRWMVNATCYETGRNWRFSLRRMGDYVTNYVLKPVTPIADAIAASAAVPGVIGPLTIRSDNYHWHRYKRGQLVAGSTPAKRYALWDGGVYDNLGVEALFKPGGGFRDGFDFLVVSDASAPLSLDDEMVRRVLMPWRRALRLVDVATEQARGLRARSLVAEFQRSPEAGVYLRSGNTVDAVYGAVGREAPAGTHLGEVDVVRGERFKTTLRRLSGEEFELLRR